MRRYEQQLCGVSRAMIRRKRRFTMDFVKALTFIPEDPRWKEKVAIGAAPCSFPF
ncbi:MAG: hypothetical protein IPM07_27020 [Anaerolineales bacterium]|nr:hypothetical protein [Anaerolineales bacterium]